MKRKQPIWIEERDALAIHDRLLALHGGAEGLRDRGLLQSALARPQHHYAYTDSPDFVEMAALYTESVVCNYPFVDGNKRTGFVVGILFLELNGFEFNASEEDVIKATLELASGVLHKVQYPRWMRANIKRKRGR